MHRLREREHDHPSATFPGLPPFPGAHLPRAPTVTASDTVSSVVTTLRTSLVGWSRQAVEFVYPPVCVRCASPLPGTNPGDVRRLPSQCRFCNDCRELLRCPFEHMCLTCGAPVGPHLQTWGCRHCRGDRFAFERVVALGVYDQQLQSCCQRVKEPYGQPLTAGLSELLWEAHEATLTAADIDLVIPVPHHWWDRATGGQQPPVTIGSVLARRLSIPLTTHILAKRRRTTAQSSLSPTRRRRNLRGAFGMTGSARLDGLSVLLTDDILTTGTTADRAADVLRKAGAQRVLVAVLARGLGQSSRL